MTLSSALNRQKQIATRHTTVAAATIATSPPTSTTSTLLNTLVAPRPQPADTKQDTATPTTVAPLSGGDVVITFNNLTAFKVLTVNKGCLWNSYQFAYREVENNEAAVKQFIEDMENLGIVFDQAIDKFDTATNTIQTITSVLATLVTLIATAITTTNSLSSSAFTTMQVVTTSVIGGITAILKGTSSGVTNLRNQALTYKGDVAELLASPELTALRTKFKMS